MYKLLAKDTVQNVFDTVLYRLIPRCPVCLDNVPEGNITLCDHRVCKQCMYTIYALKGPNTKCPICRAEMDPEKILRADLPEFVVPEKPRHNNLCFDVVCSTGLLVVVIGFPIYLVLFY